MPLRRAGLVCLLAVLSHLPLACQLPEAVEDERAATQAARPFLRNAIYCVDGALAFVHDNVEAIGLTLLLGAALLTPLPAADEGAVLAYAAARGVSLAAIPVVGSAGGVQLAMRDGDLGECAPAFLALASSLANPTQLLFHRELRAFVGELVRWLAYLAAWVADTILGRWCPATCGGSQLLMLCADCERREDCSCGDSGSLVPERIPVPR